VTVPMAVLLGDMNGDGVVNSGDATITRNFSGQPVDASSFRSDLNLEGFINSADANIVRNNSGNGLPAVPASSRGELTLGRSTNSAGSPLWH
ncbi:MAG: dockerin type I domain-containing protein, partial [Verrucomicrobiota bacterium]|nr:dockerin type I domain-containing protein [Verrucomicrobiota bacterium]